MWLLLTPSLNMQLIPTLFYPMVKDAIRDQRLQQWVGTFTTSNYSPFQEPHIRNSSKKCFHQFKLEESDFQWRIIGYSGFIHSKFRILRIEFISRNYSILGIEKILVILYIICDSLVNFIQFFTTIFLQNYITILAGIYDINSFNVLRFKDKPTFFKILTYQVLTRKIISIESKTIWTIASEILEFCKIFPTFLICFNCFTSFIELEELYLIYPF